MIERVRTLKEFPVEEASACLDELLARAAKGEEIVIGAADAGFVLLVPLPAIGPESRQAGPASRTFGQFRHRIHVAEDFDEPLDDDFWLGAKTS